jgi:hypothetical protein
MEKVNLFTVLAKTGARETLNLSPACLEQCYNLQKRCNTSQDMRTVFLLGQGSSSGRVFISNIAFPVRFLTAEAPLQY